MTEINETVIDQAFDAYKAAFAALAEKEDFVEGMKHELEEYKEGSSKYKELEKEIKDFNTVLSKYQREFRMAALELDRVKTMVEYLSR